MFSFHNYTLLYKIKHYIFHYCLFLILRNLEKARNYLNKAFKIDPNNTTILYNIACLEALNNNQAKALELISKLIELNKDYIEMVLSDDKFDNLKDSKKLSPKKREEIYKIITKHSAIEWGTGRVSEKIIDKINILEATKLAMKKALLNLERKMIEVRSLSFDYLILDGRMSLDLAIPQKSIVKADEKVFSCALSSIIAKVERDRIMMCYHKKYPCYGFDKHKG